MKRKVTITIEVDCKEYDNVVKGHRHMAVPDTDKGAIKLVSMMCHQELEFDFENAVIACGNESCVNVCHPGEIIKHKFLRPNKMTQVELSKRMHMSEQQFYPIIRGICRISAKTAIRLGQALNTTPEYWLTLQNTYDLWKARNGK